MATSILLVLLSLFTASLFFVLIPGLGAFIVRAKWRRFRSIMLDISTFPLLHYGAVTEDSQGLPFRFFGSLEAIQDRNRVWIRSGDLSVAADLENVPVYILPSVSRTEDFTEALADEEPQSIPWRQISSLPAGVPIFAAGSLFFESGRPVLRSQGREPLLVVIYDGERESILRRAIWCGRQRNEYWNQFTIISLITGSFALLFLSYLFLGDPGTRVPALVSLSLSVTPLLVLLPPGVIFLLLYRRFWRLARRLRAQRDLQRLPLRYFRLPGSGAGAARLPNGERYVMLHGRREEMESRIGEDARGRVLFDRPRFTSSGDEVYLFGALAESGDSPQPAVAHPTVAHPTVGHPTDPMAELILTQGNPEINAQRCSRRSKIFTLLSGLFLSLDVVPNLFLAFMVLRAILP